MCLILIYHDMVIDLLFMDEIAAMSCPSGNGQFLLRQQFKFNVLPNQLANILTFLAERDINITAYNFSLIDCTYYQTIIVLGEPLNTNQDRASNRAFANYLECEGIHFLMDTVVEVLVSTSGMAGLLQRYYTQLLRNNITIYEIYAGENDSLFLLMRPFKRSIEILNQILATP